MFQNTSNYALFDLWGPNLLIGKIQALEWEIIILSLSVIKK